MATLKVTGVHSQYQTQQVLKGLDLTVEKGEIVALLGPSGCGKTTLLRAIAGLQHITQGVMCINGKTVAADKLFVASEQRGVGMIFQDYALFPHLTVAENVLFGLKNTDKAQKVKRLEQMLTLVKLEGLGDRYPHELSGGQQQRVSIARSLAYEPEVLLLDEPFSNIDAKVRREMMLEIRQILKKHSVSAVFVTHSKDEAFVFADKLALFSDGKIVQCGDPEQLYLCPKDKYVADFLGASNYLAASVTGNHTVSTLIGSIASTVPLGLAHNELAQLLLRPQQLRIEKDDDGHAVVIERRFLGNVCQYLVAIAEQILDVHCEPLAINVGDKVTVSAIKHNLILLKQD
ncbi:ABC transporter ATP-binding protein [Shewanella youngdeokensis]|uniref:ABC transporter ATP-binding protein n=1 Tax=Shewanella youngdeokensis TaxID=2999068 RepID=A0ABZ0K029_9GAMM|nr:ABC transporter ATP-binding protein [Shewanella sp. DAU334]